MEENLLKYFTNNNTYTNETIKPINIDNGVVSDLPTMGFVSYSMVTNDGNYFIRYGGRPQTGNYNAIEVYNNNSLKEGHALYTFSSLTIYGHTFTIRDMKQDEDGRFYAIGQYYDANLSEEIYLILFNNFIQDGYCQIRKFYTTTEMGITEQSLVILDVIKKEGSADYYMRSQSQNKIYHFKINILEGNSLETYNFTDTTTITTGTYSHNLQIINNNLILMELWNDTSGNISCKKLVIDLDKDVQNSYAIQEILYKSIESNKLISTRINNFKYYVAYLQAFSDGFYLVFEIIDLAGNIKTYIAPETYQWTNDEKASFIENYFTFKQGNTLELFYYNLNTIEKFYSGTFSGNLTQIQVLKEFNLVNIIGINSQTSLAYSMNVYSIGYSSDSYLNKNFLIPQYLNLYATANDNTSLIYSRDVINRFYFGNQLTTSFNVPNYLLNNVNINEEKVYGQTNLSITDINIQYTKNRFENLYLNYMYTIQIIDNTNQNNLLNIPGSNRLANSVWNILDNTNTACLKARITHEDGSQSILELDTTNISDNTCTINYNVSGSVRKIEYLSNDEETIYATYRCELTGTNTIEQTITIS